MTNALVPIHEFYSALEAEMAVTALSEAGIAATIQGAVAGQLLASLTPARFPLLVSEEQADAAREVLHSLGIIELLDAPTEATPPTENKRAWRVTRTLAGLYGFGLIALAGVTVAMIIGIAIADVVHPTPHGHMIDPLVPLRYVVAVIALLLTFSKWARSKGIIAILALVVALMAASIAPRTSPSVSPPSVLRTRSPW